MNIPARLQPYLIAAVASIGLAGFVGFDLHRERMSSIAEVKTSTSKLAELLEVLARRIFARADGFLIVGSRLVADKAGAAADFRADPALGKALQALLPSDGSIVGFTWLDASGTVLIAWPHPQAIGTEAPRSSDWFLQRLASMGRQIVLGKPEQNAAGQWSLPIGKRLFAADGSPAGALLALLDASTLQPVLDTINTGSNGFATLFAADGWMLVTAPRDDALFARNWADTPLFTEHLPSAAVGTVQQVVVRDNTERLYSYRALAEYPVIVSVGVSMTDALADWRARVRQDGGLLATMIGALLWGAAAMSRAHARRETAELAMQDAAGKNRAIIDCAADGIVTVDARGAVQSNNLATSAMFGYGPEELIGGPLTLLLPQLDGGDAAAPTAAGERRTEGIGRRRDGSEFPVEIAVTKVPQLNRALQVVLIRDITDSKQAQATADDARGRAEQSERLLRAVTDNLPLRIAYVDRELRYRFVNRAHCIGFGLEREAILGRTREELLGKPVPTVLREKVDAVLRGQPQRFEFEASSDGGITIMETYLVPEMDESGIARGFYSASADVTERHEQRRRLEVALAERETLLREVYHRVKNNLQVVQSLLNMQRRSLPEGLARAALDESVRRVHAMALVHEKLYQTGTLSAVSLREYTRQLLRDLADTSGAEGRGITLTSEVEAVQAGLEFAVPYGLLVTELVSNALKHGFADGRPGQVLVQLARDGAKLCLRVSNDGAGLPVGFEIGSTASMGLQLATGLAAQLGGQLQAGNGAAVVFTADLTNPA